MSLPIKLSELAGEMLCQNDEALLYVNRKTGELYLYVPEEWTGEPPNEEVLESDDWLDAPGKFDIHEWSIMESFANCQHDESLMNELLSAIHRKGAFRHFKDVVYQHGIMDQWYKFKDREVEQIAKEWCEDNDIPYIHEMETDSE